MKPSLLNRIRAWRHLREYLEAKILPAIHCSSNADGSVTFLQTTERPPHFFLLPMRSERLGIMRTVKCTPYPDFGVVCFAVESVWTEYYQDRN